MTIHSRSSPTSTQGVKLSYPSLDQRFSYDQHPGRGANRTLDSTLSSSKLAGLNTSSAANSLSVGSTASCDSFVQVDHSFFTSSSPNPYRTVYRRQQQRQSYVCENNQTFDDSPNASFVDPYLTSSSTQKRRQLRSSPRRRDDEQFRKQQEMIEQQLQQLSFEFPPEPTELQSSFLNDHEFFPFQNDDFGEQQQQHIVESHSTSPSGSTSGSATDHARRRPKKVELPLLLPPPPPPLTIRKYWEETSVSVASPDYSSVKTEDAAIQSLSTGQQQLTFIEQQERNRQTIQTILHWRNIVCLRSERNPLSLATARAYLELGQVLLGSSSSPKDTTSGDPLEAQRAFQSAYRIFAHHLAQPNNRFHNRLRLSMAVCMERMGIASSALVAASTNGELPKQQALAMGEHGDIEHEQQQQQLIRAYTVQLEAFRLRQNLLGTYHVDTVSTLNLIAKLHLQSHNVVEAQRCLWQVYWARVSIFGSHHPSCAVSAHDIGNLFVRLHALEDAMNFYHIALQVYDTMELSNENPAVRKLLKDMKRLERVERSRGYNIR